MAKILLGGGIVVERQYFVDTIAEADDFRLCSDFNLALTSKVINAGRMLSTHNQVYMLGTIGQDHDGEYALSELKKFKFNTGLIRKTDQLETGKVAVITNAQGVSANTVYLGANELTACPADLEKYDCFYLATSLPLDTLYQILETKPKGKPTLLDVPNKQEELDSTCFKYVDFLTPNRKEAELLTDMKINTVDQAFEAAKILQKFTKGTVVISLDIEGCVVVNSELKKFVPTPEHEPIDTTGAGDIFRGIFFNSFLKTGEILPSAKKAVKLANESTLIKGVYHSIEAVIEEV